MSNSETLLETPDVRARIMSLAPGTSTPLHHHSEVTDYIVCLAGRIVIETHAPEAARTLEPGEYFTVLPGCSHRVCNALEERSSRYLLLQGVGSYDFIEGNR